MEDSVTMEIGDQFRNCEHCQCCMNKETNPFCFEHNKIVKPTETCKLYESDK